MLSLLGFGGGSNSNLMGGISFEATGGTKLELGSYYYHFFTGPGTFTVDSGTADVQYVCIGGGGGGGTRDGGGGGAGALYSGTFSDTDSPFPISLSLIHI